jgi:predicted ester cyclase
MSDINTNKALVRRYFEEVLNGRDVRHVDELCATEYMEHAVAPFADSEPGPVDGPEHLRNTLRWLTEQYPDLRMNVEALVAEDDLVVARVLSYGTNLGRLNGTMRPTGKCFSSRQTHWFRVSAGKLVEHWVTREDLTAMLQMGVVRRPEHRAA